MENEMEMKMTTEVMDAYEPGAVEKGAAILKEGGVVAFPTETVYGLGALATSHSGVEKIFEAKGRPADNPLIVHIADMTMLKELIEGDIPLDASLLAEEFWPGPLSMIFKKSKRVPDIVTAGLDTVAVRMPSNPAALMLIKEAGPIAAPSANRSGRPSPTSAKHVLDDMNGQIPLILDSGSCRVGLESTVLDLTCTPPRVLRPGGVTPDQIALVIDEVEVDGSVLRPMKEDEVARSPGMKYRHYAPQGSVTIVKGGRKRVAGRICRLYDEALAQGKKPAILASSSNRTLYGDRTVRMLGSGVAEQSRELFAALREMDDIGAEVVFSEALEAKDMGLAYMNRLGRAASFHIIDADRREEHRK
ncbi:MAG: L-threonylcarbamoyladenylate synthase [Eubacteriales bacterium]|nr:L-threonylcarbamoyladenylate synthase [Eubacteriales bacterium]